MNSNHSGGKELMDPKEIVKAAAELGYYNCGIIKIDQMTDYADKLRIRIEQTPENTAKYSELYRHAHPQQEYPWAKSIVVCVRRYGKYDIPSHLEGLIAKFYLTDGRKNEDSPDYQASIAFENRLTSMGLKAAAERKFGITALRWAAYKAGLGIIRRNNFFYADCGSWVYLEAWLIDEEMELIQEHAQKPCPPKCSRCMEACPTKSLREPYTMSRATCISCLTTWDGDDLINEPHNRNIGSWVYGCDVCQDVCPHNRNKWEPAETYPGLNELAGLISLEQIVRMDYNVLYNTIQSRFWYISRERIWKWKVNALNAMRNAYQPEYEEAILAACSDEDEHVRKTAEWVRLSIQ